MQELNKLRLVALMNRMPELLEVLSSVLLKEDTITSNPQIKTLLQTCVHFLSNNKNSQERLAITHKINDTLSIYQFKLVQCMYTFVVLLKSSLAQMMRPFSF